MRLIESLKVRKYDNSAKNGKLIEIFRGGSELGGVLGTLSQITYHTLCPGEFGGNHYHKEKVEIIYLIKGELDVELTDLMTNEAVVTKVYEGSKFNLENKIHHRLVNNSVSNAEFIEFASLAFNPENPRNDLYML